MEPLVAISVQSTSKEAFRWDLTGRWVSSRHLWAEWGRPEEPGGSPSAPQPNQGSDPVMRKVLIVNANSVCPEALRDVLADWGYQVIAAEGGTLALRSTPDIQRDLIRSEVPTCALDSVPRGGAPVIAGRNIRRARNRSCHIRRPRFAGSQEEVQ